MIQLFGYVRAHLQKDFRWPYYAAMVLSFASVVAYGQLWDRWVEQRYFPEGTHYLYCMLLYTLVYTAGMVIALSFSRASVSKKDVAKALSVAAFGILLYCVNFAQPLRMKITLAIIDVYHPLFSWIYRLLSNLLGVIVYLIPLLLFARLAIGKPHSQLGIFKKSYMRPYFIILACLLPFIVLASFQKGFDSYYPTFLRYEQKGAAFTTVRNLVYELCYGVDFFNTEFFFRGFLIVGIGRWLGREAIFPMAILYCAIHFGKPFGEIISSFFGGYVLGVITFYTRSIWGGVCVHLGIAWMMELFAYLHTFFPEYVF